MSTHQTLDLMARWLVLSGRVMRHLQRLEAIDALRVQQGRTLRPERLARMEALVTRLGETGDRLIAVHRGT